MDGVLGYVLVSMGLMLVRLSLSLNLNIRLRLSDCVSVTAAVTVD